MANALTKAADPELDLLRRQRFNDLRSLIAARTESAQGFYKRAIVDSWHLGEAFAEIRKQRLYEHDAAFMAAHGEGERLFDVWVSSTGWSPRCAAMFESLNREWRRDQIESTGMGLMHLLEIAKAAKGSDDPEAVKASVLAAIEGQGVTVPEAKAAAEKAAKGPAIDVTPVEPDEDAEHEPVPPETRHALPPAASDTVVLGEVPTLVQCSYWDPVKNREVKRVNRNEVGAPLIGHLAVRADVGEYVIELQLGAKPCLTFSRK